MVDEKKKDDRNLLKRFWSFLKRDSWQSWVVSLIIAFVFIKFVFFPGLSFVTGTPLPLVVVESCSMYHSENFEGWWESNGAWYERKGIQKNEFEEFGFKSGLNKGDIVLVKGSDNYEVGEIIVFNSVYRFPVIHRLVKEEPYGTKGDNGKTNPGQLSQEKEISEEQVLGKAVARIPGLGWLKLIFFEGTREREQRGFCR
jgi:signal peptidase I